MVLMAALGTRDRDILIYTIDSYHLREDVMADTAIARLFTHGRSQAVRLPKEFRLPGDRVRVRHVGDGVLLEPIASDVDAWFAELDRFADVPLFEDGRNQPPMPPGEDIFG